MRKIFVFNILVLVLSLAILAVNWKYIFNNGVLAKDTAVQDYYVYISKEHVGDGQETYSVADSPDFGDVVQITPCSKHQVTEEEKAQFKIMYKIIKVSLTQSQLDTLYLPIIENQGTEKEQRIKHRKYHIDLDNLSALFPNKEYFNNDEISLLIK